MTWAKFIDICKEKSIGAYRGRVTKLKEELVNNVDGVHLSTRKVQLDSWRAVALYLQLANRDRLHLPGDNPQPERPLSFFPTPLADYFQIFESDLDVGYDLSHCTKEVVVNMGLHGIDLWLQDQHAKHPG